MSGGYKIVDPYGDEALVTQSKDEVKTYLQNLLDHEVSIDLFNVTLNGELVSKTILLMKE